MTTPGLHTLAVGDVIEGPTITVTQDLLDAYADVSGDRNPLHRDPAFAARVSPTGGVIAHGMLTLAHLSALVTAWARGAENVLSMSLKFRTPVPVGAAVAHQFRMAARDAGSGTVTLALAAHLPDGTPVVDERRSHAVVREQAGTRVALTS